MVNLVPIIVTHNRLDKLKIAINCWLKTDILKLLVVNNASSDRTEQYLKELSIYDDRVIVLNQSQNLGGAGGFYKGIEYALDNLQFDWLVLHDDDAYPVISSIDYFLKNKDLSKADAYMSAVFYPSGEISLMNIPGYLPFKNFKQALKSIFWGTKGFHIDESCFYTEKEISVDFASFVGFFVRREVVEQVGLPRKDFFMYGDDIEYTIRITKAGFRIKFDPNLKFIHDCETLCPGRNKIYKPIWKAYFTYRNGIIVYKKLSSFLFPFVLSSKLIIWFKNGLFYSEKKRYYRALWRAIIDGIKENTENNLEMIKLFAEDLDKKDINLK